LPIFLYGQPVLRRKARPIRRVEEDLVQLAADMTETMKKANGVGLAATQVGDLRRIIVVDPSALEETKELPPFALLNPEIVAAEGAWNLEEGCLSIPELREEVPRAETVKVRFHDLEFREQELTAPGMFGRVIQHEIDHLNGVLFIDHLNAVKRKLLRGRLNKIERGEVEVDYPVVVKTPEGVTR
jgi:peptide deformylase